MSLTRFQKYFHLFSISWKGKICGAADARFKMLQTADFRRCYLIGILQVDLSYYLMWFLGRQKWFSCNVKSVVKSTRGERNCWKVKMRRRPFFSIRQVQSMKVTNVFLFGFSSNWGIITWTSVNLHSKFDIDRYIFSR